MVGETERDRRVELVAGREIVSRQFHERRVLRRRKIVNGKAARISRQVTVREEVVPLRHGGCRERGESRGRDDGRVALDKLPPATFGGDAIR